MKKILWTVAAIPMLILLFIGAVIANNVFFDETLNAKAAATGEPGASSVPEAQNGYLALIAMGAADGADGPAYARAWLAETRAAARENRAEKAVEVKRATRPDLCDAAQVSCLAAVQDKAEGINAQLDAYKEDLQRYEQLIASRAYEEVLDYPARLESRFPPYAQVGRAQRAYLVRAALAVQAGNIEDALSAVERDMAFQRVMLGGTRTLIGKMVAAANYSRDLAFVADLLQTRKADLKPFAPRLTEMLKPIAPAALRLDAAFESEFGMMKQALKNPAAASSVVQGSVYEMIGTRFFYKPNATINKFYGSYMQIAELSRKPPAVLARDGQKPHPASEEMKFRDYIDNPIGNVLLRIATPSFGSYALRLHDLDAYNRLLGLGVEIIAADVDAEGVADFVAKSDARFHDPYSGKPMAWDAGSKQLSFKGSDALAKRKCFNMDKGRLFLRM